VKGIPDCPFSSVVIGNSPLDCFLFGFSSPFSRAFFGSFANQILQVGCSFPARTPDFPQPGGWRSGRPSLAMPPPLPPTFNCCFFFLRDEFFVPPPFRWAKPFSRVWGTRFSPITGCASMFLSCRFPPSRRRAFFLSPPLGGTQGPRRP